MTGAGGKSRGEWKLGRGRVGTDGAVAPVHRAVQSGIGGGQRVTTVRQRKCPVRLEASNTACTGTVLRVLSHHRFNFLGQFIRNVESDRQSARFRQCRASYLQRTHPLATNLLFHGFLTLEDGLVFLDFTARRVTADSLLPLNVFCPLRPSVILD